MNALNRMNHLQTNFYFTYFTFWGFYFSAGYFVCEKLHKVNMTLHQGCKN